MKKRINNIMLLYTAFACVSLGSLVYGGCHNEGAEKPQVEKLEFENKDVTMKIGERQAVKIKIEPNEARKYTNVIYTPSANGYIIVSEQSNDGCVITAQKGGIVVLVAKAGNYTAYLEVKIAGDQFIQVPYIQVPTQVIEVMEGSRKTVQVSLYNGSAADQQLFRWSVEPGKDNISINPTGNTVVVQGEKRGSQKVFIKHDKSEYDAEILVFIVGNNEAVRYITTGQNVITMSAGGVSKELTASLVGGGPADIAGFTFTINDEYPCIGILPINNSCNIVAYRHGTAVININHPLAEYDMQVRVIVTDGQESYIDVSPLFTILDIGKSVTVNAAMNGYYLESWANDWEFTKRGDLDAINITQAGSQFFAQARETGRCVLEIKNKSLPSYPRESLIVVRDPAAAPQDEYYITTSQNVIQLEQGQMPVQLSIQLINGIGPDKNNFVWTVEDGRVITVEPLDENYYIDENGKKTAGPKYISRSMKNRAISEIKNVTETLAMITPLKAGTTKITIEHPKSPSSASVIVKVYPKGTFGSQLYVLGRKEGGIIKIDTTKQADVPVNLYIAKPDNGDIWGLGSLNWSIKPRNIGGEIAASLQDLHGLQNEIHGTGHNSEQAVIHTLLVENDSVLKYPFEATVIVGNNTQLANTAVLYADQMNHTVAIGQSAYVQILNSNMEANTQGVLMPDPAGLSESVRYTVKGYDRAIVNAVMVKNRLMLQGLSEGLTVVTVANEAFPKAVPVDIKVTVLPGSTTLDKPFMLTGGANFIGMVWGATKEYEVRLAAENQMASAAEEDKIFWTSSNGALVSPPIHPYGKKILLSAGNKNLNAAESDKTGQAVITASHSKSINDKVTVVYVVAAETDLVKKVVLGISKEHWLLGPGDEVMMNLITNADDTQDRNINDIKWFSKNNFDFAQGASDSLIEVEYNGPNAMVRAKENVRGSTWIEVRHPNNVIPLRIYISVSNTPPLARSITLPAIVEVIVNENKVITAVTEGLLPAEINKIGWLVEDEGIASISTDLPITNGKIQGGKLYLKGKKKGQTWITASMPDIGYIKKILLVCANTYEELMSTYVIAAEQSYYRMKKGDVKTIKLVYGQAGFPESQKAALKWTYKDQNNVVKFYPENPGEYAEVEGLNEGIARLEINHPNVLKSIELTFEVSRDMVPGQNYAFTYNGMMGLVVYKPSDGPENEFKEPFTKHAILGIDPPGLSLSGIEWEDEKKPDSGIVDVAKSGLGNDYMVTGRKKGQTYLRFHHSSGMVPDDARILVYTAESLQELQTMFPVGISRTNYLLNKGDPAELIKITVPSQQMTGLSNAAYKAKLDEINYSTGVLSGANVINVSQNASEPIDYSKYHQEYTVTPFGAGSAYIDITQGSGSNRKIIDRIYISVREKAAGDLNKRILTESIIGMAVNTVGRKTSIGTNLTAEERKDLEWVSLDPNVVELNVTGDKTSCLLNAKGNGNTEIVVSYGGIERYIKVYVRETDAEVRQFKEINLDTRYYHLRKNDTLPLTAFHAAMPAVGDDEWEFSTIDNKVVEIQTKDKDGKPLGKDKVKLLGINEGLTEIILSNKECNSDVRFMVEVNNTAPLVETVIEDWYLTAIKTVYALDPDNTKEITRIPVTGVKFPADELRKIKWTVYSETFGEGDSKVTHILDQEPGYRPVLLTLNNTTGDTVNIQANKKAGTAVLRASHARSVNDMDITVICDAKEVLANTVPHIETSKETVKLQLNEEDTVDVFIRDLDSGYDIGKFAAVCDKPLAVQVDVTGNRLFLKGNNFGQALISITHPDVPGFVKKIIVIVMSGDTSLVYLTTKQNFVVIEKQGYQQIEVELVGYNDINNKNYIWSTDDHDIISISDSGKQAVVTAKSAARTAKITVRHKACPEYPLHIYVRVTEKDPGNPVYITTANNIVSIKEGAGVQVKANLVNGGGQELSQFVWSTNHNNLIELNYSGDTSLIKGITPGTAQVQIWHPSSLNSITILIVVEPLEPNNGIYIAVDNQLIEMTTSESQRRIQVRLIGGSPEDVYGFQWSVTNFSSVIKQANGNSYQPVNILSNADTCYIQPVTGKYEGEATITVSHPKTSYKLDIKVIIADATEIQFSQNYVNVQQFSQQTVAIKAPANGALNITVQQSEANPVVRAFVTSNLCIVEGLQEGTAIVRISNVSGTKSDELVVRVLKTDTANYAYIHVLENLMWDTTISDTRTITVMIKGIPTSNENDQIQILNLLNAKITNESVIFIEHIYDKSRGQDGNYTWMMSVKSKGTGSSELEFSIPAAAIESNKTLFDKYPALKGAVKKVYFKVSEGTNIFAVDKTDIQMYEGSAGEPITATIDMGKSEGILAEHITWEVQNAEGVTGDVIKLDKSQPPNNVTGSYTVRISAEKAGMCYIVVRFANKGTKYITVRVNPVEYLRVDRTSVTIGPGVNEYIRVTSNPDDMEIVYSFDTNQAVETAVYGSPVNENGEPAEAFKLQSGAFKAGAYGYILRVTGNEYQGTARMTIKVVSSGRQTQISFTNVKNYFARWVGAASLRFRPDAENGSRETRIYYECNPLDDRLLSEDGHAFDSYFRIEYQSDQNKPLNDGTGNYIRLLRPVINGVEQSYFLPRVFDGSDKLHFITEKTKQRIELPVYVYFEKIDITWERDKSYTNGNPNARSEFDEATYALKIALGGTGANQKEELKIRLKVPDNNPAMLASIQLTERSSLSGYTVNIPLERQGPEDLWFTISRNTAVSDAQYRANNLSTGVEYSGILEIKFKYLNGSDKYVEAGRKFLIYAKNY